MGFDFLVFGGRSHPNAHQRPPWDRYEAGVMLEVRNGAVVDRLEYRGWELDREVGLSVCFRVTGLDGEYAYTCTSTQVVKIDLRTRRVVDCVTDRLFNDLHHVTRIGERFFVAATGIDSVLEYDPQFRLLQRYPIARDELLAKHGADSDFRRIPTTKPHHAHPNFVAQWGDEIWVTNFEAGRVESLRGARRHAISDNRIHDGVPAFDRVWFTAVNGAVITLDPRDGTLETHDLAAMTRTDRRLGWCRGIAPVGSHTALVGFSKLRETKLRENLKWLGNKLLNQDFALSEPTRIIGYDFAQRSEIWRLDLEAHGMDAVFSVNALP